MSKLFISTIILYLPRYPTEEGTERIASESHQRTARNSTTVNALIEGRESIERHQ